jgi:hypothetical protein
MKRKKWSREKFAAIAAEICEYAIDHYRFGGKDGFGFSWFNPETKSGMTASTKTLAKVRAWECLQDASHIIACLLSQHALGGDDGVEVCTDLPFEALKMWKDIPEEKRRKLAERLYTAVLEDPQ